MNQPKEEKYKTKFVKEILSAVKERPAFLFRNSDSFLFSLESLDQYTNPKRIKKSYKKALKKHPPSLTVSKKLRDK